MNNINLTVEIDHSNKNYKILKTIVNKDVNGNLCELTSNDANIYSIMLENFLDNCYNNNIKFALYYDCTFLKTIPVLSIPDFLKVFKKKYEIISKNLIGSTISINGDSFKNLINLFLKFYTPTKPIKSSKNYEESLIFFEECINNKYKDKEIIY